MSDYQRREDPLESTAQLALLFTKMLVAFTVLLLGFPIHAYYTGGDAFGYFIPVVTLIPAILMFNAYAALAWE